MNTENLVTIFSKLHPTSTMLSIKKYRNEYNEVSNFGLSFHFSYINALNKSFEIANKFESTTELEIQAKEEICKSFLKSINEYSEMPVEEKEDAFIHFKDANNNWIKGIKFHKENMGLYLYALQIYKVVVEKGERKEVNKRPLTVIKDKIRNMTPCSKIRMFRLLPEKFESIAVQSIKMHTDVKKNLIWAGI